MESGWIVSDKNDMLKGRCVKLRSKGLLELKQSKFQKIEVYDTVHFGKVLLIDDIIMLSEADEFAYHEMIVHVPLSVHPEPERVLIVGGGDGGAAREVVKHSDVKEVHVCEIDEEVVEVCRRHLPALACGFDDDRVEVFYEDAALFIKEKKGLYDVIIVDSTDPIGPGESLFREDFYRDMHAALREDGVVVTQSESMFDYRDLISSLFRFNKGIYSKVYYYLTLVPTYPSGTIGFSFCSKKYDPLSDLKDKKIPGLMYYTSEIHRASFVLPGFMGSVISGD
ncbi:MAG: polyamine aminopropyltransferase [Candidatus Altiarchaeota archaeon]|nr:polyamine aminopropyltransferase [Candidatus Altiarchaeota archaeon]